MPCCVVGCAGDVDGVGCISGIGGRGHFGEVVQDYADVSSSWDEGVLDRDIPAGIDVELFGAWFGVGAADDVEGVEEVFGDGVVFVALAA